MFVSKDGLVQCSTLNFQVGLNLSDREYFRKAQQTGDFVFSDYLFGKTNNRPMMMAAYPVAVVNAEQDAVVVAGINIDWLSKIMPAAETSIRCHLLGSRQASDTSQ